MRLKNTTVSLFLSAFLLSQGCAKCPSNSNLEGIMAESSEGFDSLDDLYFDEDFYNDEEDSANPNDPLEPFNRVMHVFNEEYLWKFTTDPITDGYSPVCQRPFRR